MENVNSLFRKVRPRAVYDYGDTLTVPGLSNSIAEFVKSGTVESVSERIRKRFIFGQRVRLEDLTAMDYYNKKVQIYNNIFKSLRKGEEEKVTGLMNNKEEEKNIEKSESSDNKPLKKVS